MQYPVEGYQEWSTLTAYKTLWPAEEGEPLRNLAVEVLTDIMLEPC